MSTQSNIVTGPIQEGDAGVIIRRDGAIQAFIIGPLDPKNLTEEQINQAQLLQAAIVALTDPSIKASLIELVDGMNARGVTPIDDQLRIDMH